MLIVPEGSICGRNRLDIILVLDIFCEVGVSTANEFERCDRRLVVCAEMFANNISSSVMDSNNISPGINIKWNN